MTMFGQIMKLGHLGSAPSICCTCQFSSAPRSGCVVKHAVALQNLGWYDPLRKETNLNAPAIKKWLSVGAQPSDTVRALLKKAMVID